MKLLSRLRGLVLGLMLLPATASAANVFYTSWKESLLTGANNLSSVTVKIVLIDAADYTVSASHDFLDDVAAGARVCTAQTLGTKTTTNGVFSSAAVTFTSCSGDQAEAYLLYIDTGVESTSRLIAYIDTAASGLPVTPNGGNITITPHASNGWFYFALLDAAGGDAEALAFLDAVGLLRGAANDDTEVRLARASNG